MDKGFILFLIFAVLIGVFAVGNSERVVINFILTEIEISQALVIIVSALLGAMVVFLTGLIRQLSYKKEIKEKEKEISKLKENTNVLEADLKKARGDLKISEDSFAALKDLE